MLKKTKSITVTGQSNVSVNGTERMAVSMSANIPADGSTSITKAIVDKELFNSNKAECKADMAEFDEYIYSLEESAE